MTIALGPVLRVAAATAMVAVSLWALAPVASAGAKTPHASAARVGHGASAHSVREAGSQNCPPETNSCTPTTPFPCDGTGCTITAGPVTNLGEEQAVYVQVSGVPSGDQVVLALCSLAQSTQVVADPVCASSIPAAPGCKTQSLQPCPNTPSPLQWQYGTSTGGTLVMSIGTELDPAGSGNTPITSQTAEQYLNGNTYGSFYCDDGPTNFCGIEVMDIPAASAALDVVGNGVPPRTTFVPTAQNTAIIPISWASAGNGCGSAPIMEVDSAYSAEQFLFAGGASTCNQPGTGVAVLPTSIPSVDDPGCTTGTGTHCPINDVLDGNTPVTFTDDPEDPATLAEERQAGDHVAYIPIAVSATEIAFQGEAAETSLSYPLDSYELTPAQVAGVMTQLWNDPVAQYLSPNDDLCGQLTGKANCIEAEQTETLREEVETVGGKYANLVVDSSANGKATPAKVSLNVYGYGGKDDYFNQEAPLTEKDYQGDTGYELLNPAPVLDGEPVPEGVLGAVFPSTASGASYEATSWMCAAPEISYDVHLPWSPTDTSLKDLMSSAQILTNAEQGPLAVNKNAMGQYVAQSTVSQYIVSDPSDCQGVSSLPTDFAGTSNTESGSYLPSSSPVTEAHAIQGAVANTYAGRGGFAMGAMDSSQADLYGLLPASLQNAAGQFVEPDETSIDAALNDATINPDGTLKPNFDDTGDPSAYPLPMVTYALVSTAPQPSLAQAQELRDVLTNLVQYSHTGGAGYLEPLPAGYEPLTDTLYQDALNDIARDIANPGATTPTTAPPTTIPPSTTTGVGGGGYAPAYGGGTTVIRSSSGGLADRPYTGPVSGSTSGQPPRSLAVSGTSLSVTLTDERFALPGLLVLALLCLIGGPLLYLIPTWRRRRPAPADLDQTPSDEGG